MSIAARTMTNFGRSARIGGKRQNRSPRRIAPRSIVAILRVASKTIHRRAFALSIRIRSKRPSRHAIERVLTVFHESHGVPDCGLDSFKKHLAVGRGSSAKNGQHALDRVTAGDAFDLILMDMQMPAMDGLEATRRIRTIEREQSRARTPILALTANALRAIPKLVMVRAAMDIFLNRSRNKP